MGKSLINAVIDPNLDYIEANAVRLMVCSTEPTDYNEAHVTYMLAEHIMTDADFTVGEGDVSGRKVAVAEQAAITITNTGTAAHIALCTADTLLLVTTCDSQGLTAANTVTVPTWDYEITDPT